MDFDPGPGTSFLGGIGIFILNLDTSGGFNWVKGITGNSAGCTAESIALDPMNNVYLTGSFTGTTDFDPGPGTYYLTEGSTLGDIFVFKASACHTTNSSLDTTVCKAFKAPDGKVYASSGQYAATILTKDGCDSVISINLTVNTPDTTVDQNGATLAAHATNVKYQWLDCVNNSIVDSVQTYTAVKNGSYAVIIDDNGCIDTSGCFNVTTVGTGAPGLIPSYHIYPNPSDGILNISIGEPAHMLILDAPGRTVYDTNIKGFTTHDLSVLSQGIYYVKLVGKYGTVTEKLLITR